MEAMAESLPVLKSLEEYRQEYYWLPPGSFAWFLGISPSFYQRIIGGIAWVSEQTQQRIAARLGVSPDQILEFRVPEVPASLRGAAPGARGRRTARLARHI